MRSSSAGRSGSGKHLLLACSRGRSIYLVSQHNGTYVLAAQPKYQLLAHNELGDDSRANASPAISDGHLFLRTDQALYCIGSK